MTNNTEIKIENANFFFWLGDDGFLDELTEDGFEYRIERERTRNRSPEDLEVND